MTWRSLNDLIDTDWPDPPVFDYSEAEAEIPCPRCDNLFFTEEGLELHLPDHTKRVVTRKATMQERPRKPRHGTWSEYSRYRCRCGPCTQAGREYQREKYARRLALCSS